MNFKLSIIFITALVAIAGSHRFRAPTCAEGGTCSDAELMAMPHEKLVKLFSSRTQGRPIDDDENAVYWTRFKDSDCDKHDLLVTCKAGDIEGCKSLCEKTSNCGGFNMNGFVKTSNCIDNIAPSWVDLWVKSDKQLKPAWPYIWPHPQAYSNGSKTVFLDAAGFEWLGPAVADMAAALSRYSKLTFPREPSKGPVPGQPTAKSLVVSVKDLGADLQLGVDESYLLTIPEAGNDITIEAQTIFGAYRGLETFSQLVQYDYDDGRFFISAAPWKISDFPRFAHRELLLDSSRHFLPLATLKQIVEALAYIKINTVHWHFVDDQSFPIDLPSFPSFSSKGSYNKMERYSLADVAEFVSFAKQRGIRIVPEVDMPGHASSWCAADPSICPTDTCRSPLNVAHQHTFDVIAQMQKDLVAMFPDKMLHLGGDEVDTTCWTKTPEIVDWMKQHHMDAEQAYKYFVDEVHKSAHAAGRETIGWEEIWRFFGTALDKSTIIHQWLSGSDIAVNATAHGYRVLWSTSSAWYLDWLPVTWQMMYIAEPCKGIPDDLCKKFVLGGGGEMWGETADTSDIQATIFPRLAAIAERLWSPQDVADVYAAKPRFIHLRCLLNSRGVGAAPHSNIGRAPPEGPGPCTQ